MVTTYTVTPYIGTTAQTATTLTGSPPETKVTISGLTPGTTYTFKVQASNPNGAGPVSAASNPVTPTPPTAPASADRRLGERGDRARRWSSWSAPSNEGGSADHRLHGDAVRRLGPRRPRSTVGASATSTTLTGL